MAGDVIASSGRVEEDTSGMDEAGITADPVIEDMRAADRRTAVEAMQFIVAEDTAVVDTVVASMVVVTVVVVTAVVTDIDSYRMQPINFKGGGVVCSAAQY